MKQASIILVALGLLAGAYATDPDSGKTFAQGECCFEYVGTGEHYQRDDTLFVEVGKTYRVKSVKYDRDTAWTWKRTCYCHPCPNEIALPGEVTPLINWHHIITLTETNFGTDIKIIKHFDGTLMYVFGPQVNNIIHYTSYLLLKIKSTTPDTSDTTKPDTTIHHSDVIGIFEYTHKPNPPQIDTLRLGINESTTLMIKQKTSSGWANASADEWERKYCGRDDIYLGGGYLDVSCSTPGKGVITAIDHNSGHKASIVVIFENPVQVKKGYLNLSKRYPLQETNSFNLYGQRLTQQSGYSGIIVLGRKKLLCVK